MNDVNQPKEYPLLERLRDRANIEPDFDMADLLEEAANALSNAVTERDEAREHADSFICGCLDSGAELPNKSGWMRNGEEDEGTFVYAAKRGLIERHPTEPLYFKFTEAGKELA